MNRKYCLDKKEWEEAQAALLLAKQFGLIEDAGIEALEKRRAKKNKENSLYGVRFYSPAMYLQYELTRFKLDFVQPSEQIKKLGVCPGFIILMELILRRKKSGHFMKITRICSGVTMEICLTMRMSGRLSKKD